MSDPLKILVVDDEDLARRRILGFLAAQHETYTIAEAVNGLEALDKIHAFAPQIVFLDVQMPGLSGFDVLYHLEERSFRIIFQTAFDEFALKAFEENACDYLLKPFSRERFDKALQRARDQVANGNFERLAAQLGQDQRFLTRLGVKLAGVRIMVEVETVDCFVSRDHYTCIHVGDKEFLSDMSLGRLEAVLDPSKFTRVHRNSIVNTRAVAMLSKSGDDEVTLKNGMTLSVSRRNRANLVRSLD